MRESTVLPARDSQLVQIVDAALADAALRSGKWLACRPGCYQCCLGAFAINQLDAARLRLGMAELERVDPARAMRVRSRAEAYLARTLAAFPGDTETGILDSSDDGQQRFESFANDEACPALDPEHGTCDLYEYRPMTCRVFGPPVRNEGGHLGVCELCFVGATAQQIADCEMKPDPDGLEAELLNELQANGATGETIVAFALAKRSGP